MKCFLIAALLLATPLLAQAEEGFESLFDGKTLNGWEGKEAFWSVQDGVITGQTTAENPTKGNTFLIYRKAEPGDFELRVKFRIEGGNSGVQYRSRDLGNSVVGGYQADFDDAMNWVGVLYEEKGRGVLAKRGEKVVVDENGGRKTVERTATEEEIVNALKKGDWNEYVIIAKGNHLVQKLNGVTTVDLVDHQEDKRKLDGILALQLHAGPPMRVQFKDIQLKKLD
ncbi:3-keto-disaccharide hydrolase [Lignipirellula cremea]|uniref:3-keto-alpha-glucoside-1,2-lyase/3-keto-2-hydroxy-glucal hydratase domain-containing protein n=1 Tax=Lignipirellula cremea TaxID=2528010 RepID=A0A518DU07_9BACT|nr:DUF1080 domain-containing protein [Lignipirellula cremea]QDU95314.1 hypothetical protein Pla8534_31290 [Lignipirellula cremea]